MGFIAWHYLIRIGFPVFMLLGAMGMLLPKNGVGNVVGALGGLGVFILGGTGAILAVRLLIRGFKFACPQCKGRETDLGMRKRALWLYCPRCGVFEESGFMKTQISHDAGGPDDDGEPEDEEGEDEKETNGKVSR
ncbi:hypothetical protein [Verrucomicrobium sp. BvORR034]|uniref:hypothetical protein n=1 Tax=Verrucomicrobium sp. BvORR034 TaxID=1396418 RepID=UPI0006792248|nr:hypothetical protein [Verrucomicrobium sp. BvORR034]